MKQSKATKQAAMKQLKGSDKYFEKVGNMLTEQMVMLEGKVFLQAAKEILGRDVTPEDSADFERLVYEDQPNVSGVVYKTELKGFISRIFDQDKFYIRFRPVTEQPEIV